MGWLERIGFLGSRRRRRELGKLEFEIGAVTAERDAYLRQRDVALGEERALVIVTHDARIFEFADRIARMDDGRVVDVKNNRN